MLNNKNRPPLFVFQRVWQHFVLWLPQLHSNNSNFYFYYQSPSTQCSTHDNLAYIQFTRGQGSWSCTDRVGEPRCVTGRRVALGRHYLLCGTWLPLQDGFCRLIIFVRHGAGEGRHSLAVADVEANVRVGDEELDDDAVLIADGGVDRSSALCILTKIKVALHSFQKNRQEPYFVMEHSFSAAAPS